MKVIFEYVTVLIRCPQCLSFSGHFVVAVMHLNVINTSLRKHISYSKKLSTLTNMFVYSTKHLYLVAN